jgi:hypothetical protein
MRRRAAVLVALCVLVVVGFYARSAVSYGKPLAPNQAPKYGNFQNPIADALLDHQLSLKIAPPPGLLALPNPYDPIANDPYRAAGLHDLSLYKGKLYAYFGPAPAILLYIPFRIFRVGDLSPTIATLVFATLGFLFSLALFRRLVRWWEVDVPTWMQCVAVFTLGLGMPMAWLVYIGRDYESSIACGYMLLFAGLYFLARGALGTSHAGFLALGSLALGLAVAARATMIVGAVFVALALVIVFRAGDDTRRRIALVAALVAPYVVMGVLVAFFNYARFGSVTEFGQSYQLTLLNYRTYPFGRWAYVPRGVFYYLFSPGRWLSHFPYLFLRENVFDPVYIARAPRGANLYFNEPVAGLVTNMPVTGAGFVLLAAGVRGVARKLPRAIPTVLAVAVPAVLVLLLTSYQLRGTTMRYELDFAPLICLGSLLGWVAWSRIPQRGAWITWLGHAVWLAALAASIAFSLAITFTPCVGTGSC